jgi:hypothetical protein
MAREIDPFSGYFDFGMAPIHREVPEAVKRIKEELNPDMVALWSTNGSAEKYPDPNLWPNYGPNATARTADTFRQAGIRVASWGAVYGEKPQKEGEIAARKANELNAEFHAFDVEGKFEDNFPKKLIVVAKALLYENPAAIRSVFEGFNDSSNKADVLIEAYRNNTDIALVFCSFGWPYSFRDPSKIWHNPKMYQVFLGQVDAGLPMAYALTEERDQAEAQVTESIRQWQTFNPGLPLIVGARGYSGDGFKFTKEATEGTYEAALMAKDAGIAVGVMWWSSWHGIRHKTGEVISQLPAWGPSIPDSEKHAANMAEYGSRIEEWARNSDAQELLLREVLKLDDQLRQNGYNGKQPPGEIGETAKLLGTIWQQSGKIVINPEKWYQALHRRVIHMGQNLKGEDRLIYSSSATDKSRFDQ